MKHKIGIWVLIALFYYAVGSITGYIAWSITKFLVSQTNPREYLIVFNVIMFAIFIKYYRSIDNIFDNFFKNSLI